jgi:hypothetical protein
MIIYINWYRHFNATFISADGHVATNFSLFQMSVSTGGSIHFDSNIFTAAIRKMNIIN